jgi:hypothetical protein
MDDRRPPSSHGVEIVIGAAMLGLRLILVFAVMGAGYLVHKHLGIEWFKVYVFAAIAAGLQVELNRIDREYPPDSGHRN